MFGLFLILCDYSRVTTSADGGASLAASKLFMLFRSLAELALLDCLDQNLKGNRGIPARVLQARCGEMISSGTGYIQAGA